MEKLKELVVAYISKTQGKTPEEVSSLLFKTEADKSEVVNDNALSGLYEWDKTRVQAQSQKFETEKKEHYDKGYGKAKAESLSKFETDLRDKYKITEDKQGNELIEAILDKQAKGSANGEPTEDQIKRSKIYLDTIDALKKEKQDVETEWKNKHDSFVKLSEKKETFKKISESALKYLDSQNPNLPEDSKLAQEWKNIYLSRINEYDFEIKDGKTIVLKKQEDGSTKILLDDHGHPVQFEALLNQKATSLFTLKGEGGSRGSGNNNDDAGSGTGKGYKGPKPRTEEEYNKLMAEARDEDQKIEITKVYLEK